MPRTTLRHLLLLAAAAAMLAPVTARAADSDSDDAVARARAQAALREAQANLLDDVARVRLTRRVSVGDLARDTGTFDDLAKVIQQAQQIGGPRWVDDQTCQIEAQIPGAAVARALHRAATDHAKNSPIAPADVARITKDWGERSFSATGSISWGVPARRPRLAPAEGPVPGVGFVNGGRGQPRAAAAPADPWDNVNDAARAQAVAAAADEAARRTLTSVRPIPLTPRSTVGEVLALKDVNEDMRAWLAARPPARVELRRDLQAEVELAVLPADAFKQFRAVATAKPAADVPLPTTDDGWDKVLDAFERQMILPVGRAAPPRNGAPAVPVKPAVPRAKPLDLPIGQPRWASRRLEAVGHAEAAASKLVAARVAEDRAVEKIRVQVEDLQMTDKVSLGKAAAADPRVARAVDRALARARLSRQAEYRAANAADVTVTLDLADLWQDLRDAE